MKKENKQNNVLAYENQNQNKSPKTQIKTNK